LLEVALLLGGLGVDLPWTGLAPSFFSSCEALWPALAGVVGVFTCDCGGALSVLAGDFDCSEPLLHPAANASAAASTKICRRIPFSP
jgi:hypothetical protein